ncbi:MAG: type IV pilus assembly protein FimV [Pseudomonadales bacterium]
MMQKRPVSKTMVSSRLGMMGILLLFSHWALGLGLGNIEVQSALSQPLRAEIELVNVDDWTASDLKVALAGTQDFKRLGVEMAPGLFDLEFDAVDGRGGAFVRVRSETAILEPFLHFVLVLDWPGGRLLKEYTVLLDLPRTTEVVAPVKRTQATRPSPEEIGADRTLASRGARTDIEQMTTLGDTLWDIALATRPDRSISIPQMMLAIQRENPEAFLGGNINRLKAGYRLRIPDLAGATRLAVQEAEAVVDAQNKALSGPQPQKKTSPSSESFIDTTPPQESEDTASQDASGAELRLVADEVLETDPSVNLEVASLTDALSQAEAALAASVSEQQALSDRLTALESNLGALTSTIEVKDRALASLQQELMTLRNQAPPPSLGWANPLVLGLLLVVVLLVVLILVLANRLRQQARWVEGMATHPNQPTEGSETQPAAESKPQDEEIPLPAPDLRNVAPAASDEAPAASDEASAAGDKASEASEEEKSVGDMTTEVSAGLSELELDLELTDDLDLGETLDLDEIDLEEAPMSHPLDLARAYIEMGDATSAKTQLAKVIATGSPDEVREAEQLLEQLPH